MRFLDLFRERCPGCRRKALSTCGGYHWSGRSDAGERTGGFRCFLRCLECDQRWVKDIATPYEPCSEEEWLAHVGPDPLPPARARD